MKVITNKVNCNNSTDVINKQHFGDFVTMETNKHNVFNTISDEIKTILRRLLQNTFQLQCRIGDLP